MNFTVLYMLWRLLIAFQFLFDYIANNNDGAERKRVPMS